MQKKWIVIVVAIFALLIAGLVYLILNVKQQEKEKAELVALAEMDKKEMENEYSQFAVQYDELKRSIKNDSLMARLTEEENKTRNLLEELKNVKANDAREIARLKKELATVRAVLRSYILQVDSLNRLNQALKDENAQVREQYNTATTTISTLTSEKEQLGNTVAIASQLDATGVNVQPLNKRGKTAKKTKDIVRFAVSFNIAKNITAKTGEKKVYVRLTKPNNEVVGQKGQIAYESSSIGYSAMKIIEYTGEAKVVTMYIDSNEFLDAGTYKVYIFVDGNMIGSGSLTMAK